MRKILTFLLIAFCFTATAQTNSEPAHQPKTRVLSKASAINMRFLEESIVGKVADCRCARALA